MSPFIVSLINHLTYLGVFIGAFIEGPIVGLLTGFLVKIGFLELFLAYIIYVFGDLTADFFYYSIGYHSPKLISKKFSIFRKKINEAEKIKKIFCRHPKKIIILGKITHVAGLPILLIAGLSHYDWRKFLFFDFLATIIKSAILIFLGYYFAKQWVEAGDVISYLNLFGLLLAMIIIYFIIRKIAKNLLKDKNYYSQ